jgi:hypothetical protein
METDSGKTVSLTGSARVGSELATIGPSVVIEANTIAVQD